MEAFGQPVDLFDVEYRVALEEGDGALHLLPLRVGFGADDAVGLDHQLAGLALPDMGSQFLGLFEG